MGKRKSNLVEAWEPTLVDRTEYLRDGVGMSYFGDLPVYVTSQASDRRHGDNPPFWTSEPEHAMIRAVARILSTCDEVAIGALDNLANYIIGDGFAFEFNGKTPDDNALARACAVAWEQFAAANHFDESVQRDLFQRSRRDGEFFVGLTTRAKSVRMRVIDAAFVTEPHDVPSLEAYVDEVGLDWKYGVATTPNDHSDVHGYFVSWYGEAEDWDYFTSDDMVHLKLNVDVDVKRGLSDYYAVAQDLNRTERLMGNTLQGAAVQAAIAYIREHADGTSPDAIRDLVSARAEVKTTDATTGRTRRLRAARPGTVVDIPAGMKYHMGPLGQSNANTFLDVVQGALRRVGIRWNMPEYMISGDASNGNFASTLVAESPFTRGAEARQRLYVRSFSDLVWKVLALAARLGVFQRFGASTLADVKAAVLLKVTPPPIAVRNKAEDHTIHKEQFESGLISKQTWAAEEGYDASEEDAQRALEQRGAPPVLPGVPPAAPPVSLPTTTPPQPSAAPPASPDVDIAATALNGAQIGSLLQVIDSVTAKRLPLESARAIVLASFPMFDADVVQRMFAPLANFTPPPAPSPVAEHWKGYP